MSTGARWVRGTGKFHLRADGSTDTVCGREVPENPQIAVYNIVGCAVCKRKAPELAEAAELQRKRDYEERVAAPLNERLAAYRAGRFAVLRCRLCGEQHARSGDGRGAVAFCRLARHVADLEVVEAIGPAWNPEPIEPA
jgi:hypothetical protein